MITINNKDVADIVIDNKNVVKIQDAITLDIMWEKVEPVVVDYFYIENTYAGQNTISITTGDSGTTTGNHATSLQYSKDKANWTTITLSGTNTIPMSQGEKVYFRNDNGYFNWYNNMSDAFITTITCSEIHSVGGNINTLLDYTDNNVSCSTGCFYQLFVENSKLTNTENLSLPATNLANLCYTQMFYLCSSLTTAPTVLPATTLASDCYSNMFSGCTALTTAPALPATTLASYCYGYMFNGCQNLTTAPALPATTLADSCYRSMFQDCTSLVNAPVLPATTLASYCYAQMFYSCTSLTTAPALPATTLASYCYAQMFRNCTSLNTAPALPVITLADSCYRGMFVGCTSLVNAPALPATTLVNGCYREMFYNCSSLNHIRVYADDISASNCINNWLYNVASSGTFYNYGSASYTYPSASGIPQGWQEVKPKEYFYIENKYNGTNTITLTTTKHNTPSSTNYSTTVQYSKDKENWTTLTFSTSTPKTISMSNGEKVYFRNDNGKFNYTDGSNWYYTTFTATNSHIVGGNIVSLLKYTNMGTFTLTKQGCLERLFEGDASLTDSYNLIFPNTTSSWCYSSMFRNCRNMTTSPLTLPATTLADWCYNAMFQNCNNLTTTPNIYATTLAEYCCSGMFTRCTSLTTAPALPATTLAHACYNDMFYECTSLTSAPILYATTLVQSCYAYMFEGCSLLDSVTSYANNISAELCLRDWLKNVSSSGTFHNLGSATYPSGTSGIPSSWTEVHS